jgi:hypothetical protein
LSTLKESEFNGASITVREDNQPAGSATGAAATVADSKPPAAVTVAKEAPRLESADRDEPAEKIPEIGKVFVSNLSFDTTPEVKTFWGESCRSSVLSLHFVGVESIV